MMKIQRIFLKYYIYFTTAFLIFGCQLISEAPISEEFPLVANAPQLAERPFETARVVQVIDGDTIRVQMAGETFSVRYIGVNTPERDEVCFAEARAANAAYVENREVRLVVDQSDTDRFGRLLRYIYVEDILVNAELVAGGWAESRRYNPDTLLFDYLEGLEETAVRQQRGCQAMGIFD